MVVSAFAAIVRSDASAYPFSRNPSFAQDKIRSETPSIGFVKLTFLLITVLYNAVININRFLFVVKYGNCQGRFSNTLSVSILNGFLLHVRINTQ